MASLSIVHVCPFFDPATCYGGPVVQLRNVCRLLAARGHDVSVVTTDLGVDDETPRDQWVPRDGYRVWYCRTSPLGRFAPHFAPGARRPLEVSLAEADLVHLSLSFTHVNLLAQQAARRLDVPYIYTPRSCLDPVRLRQRRLSKRACLSLFERKLIRDAAAVHVLTETELGQATAQGAAPAGCCVIPNGAELGGHASWPEGAAFRSQYGIPADVPLVLFMSRLHKVKGVDLLVDGFATMHECHPKTQLVIAGPDQGAGAALDAQVKRLGLEDAVRCVGHLKSDMRLAALVAADVFALTSHSEGIPNAVLDAAAAGTPSLITERCNLPEVVGYEAGCVVDADPESVATGLTALLDDPARREAMGHNARRMVSERFAFPAVVDRIEQMYRRVLGIPELRSEPRTGTEATRAPAAAAA